jgi:pimeloyl-ACP methyl ester carboxylesterase
LLLPLSVFGDWRLDINSMAQTSQLQQLAQAILDRTSSSNRAILMGHSFGALVAAKLLQQPNV